MGKTAVVLLGHGSRNQASNDEQLFFYELMKKELPTITIKNAFLQLAEPCLNDVLDDLVKDSQYNQIIISPLFLFAGVHVQKDIPDIINSYQERFPEIRFALTKHLGADPKIAELVIERIKSVE